MASMNKRGAISNVLVLVALGLLAIIYFTPIWWVALTAPNYPEEAFPDGVRINFHMNGVFNGCQKVEKAEITEDEALDCVHEMDTINHYVGMYPIAAGGVVERAFSPFLVVFLGVLLLGFMCIKRKIRLAILSVGFFAIAIWMSMAWYAKDGLSYHNTGYLFSLVTSMDQDTDKELEPPTNSGNDILDRLKASLASSEGKVQVVKQHVSNESSAKQDHILHLKSIFDVDQAKKSADVQQVWDGSLRQMMSWHYQKNLGRYFNNPAEIEPMVATMAIVADVVFFGIMGVMLVIIFGVWRDIKPLYWLMIAIPMALPVFFLIEYSAWLYWYGHTLNQMGAFTVKPFMPTVLGRGKVAQFTTHSYPAIGFILMMAVSVLLALAALIRRKQLNAVGQA